ncbi:O-antigen ligase family protein [bacterium]|nr:O-antigen ligase family protein [bacterium]
MFIKNSENFIGRLGRLSLYGITGIMLGIILSSALLGYIPQFTAGLAFMFAIIPMIVTWHSHAKKAFVALLILSMALVIDRTFSLHPEHMEGAKGFVLSMHDIALLFALFVSFFESILKKDLKVMFFPRYTLPLLGVVLMSILSMSKAVAVNFSFYELIEILKAIFVFLYIANYTYKEENYKFVITFVMIGLGIEIMFVIIEIISGSLHIPFLATRMNEAADGIRQQEYYRAGGTLGGANGLAWYLDFVLPIALALTFYKIKSFPRILSFILTGGGIIALIATFSRGGWVGFIVGGFMVWYFYIRNAGILKKIFSVLTFLLIIVMAVTLIAGTANPIKERLSENDKGSAYVRIPLMVVALSMIKANPIIGVGLNNYTFVHQNYDYGVDKITSYYPVPVHNFFLQLTGEVGIPGLLFFLLFIITVFYRGLSYSNKRSDRTAWIVYGILAGSVGFFIQGMVENTSLGSFNVYPLWVLYGTLAGIVESRRSSPDIAQTSS